jgi:DNA polymerase III alpha subunit (gram-positive type)
MVMKLMFLDIETTGFDKRWDFIIELAAIIYDTTVQREIQEFHEYIKPGKNIPEKIVELTGITNRQVNSCRTERDVLRDFVEFVAIHKPDAIVAHNGEQFDVPFIKSKTEFYFFPIPDLPVIDTLKLARDLKPNVTDLTAQGRPSYKQTSLAKFYGIEYQAHSAIFDVKALIHIYFKMKEVQKESIESKRKKLGF